MDILGSNVLFGMRDELTKIAISRLDKEGLKHLTRSLRFIRKGI